MRTSVNNITLNVSDKSLNSVDESTIDGNSSHNATATTGTAK
jgi:hypothetical protein